MFLTSALSSERSLLIEESQMINMIQDPNIIVIDVRDESLYKISHIKNAINLPVSDTFSKGKRTDLVVPLSQIIKLFGDKGLTVDSRIVLYDGGFFIDAARLFWIFETFGNENVSILNIGFDHWSTNNSPVSSEERVLEATIFIPVISPNRVSTYLRVRSIIDNDKHNLIDVRPEPQFLGLETITGVLGHIPTAINVPFTLNLDLESSKLKAKSELFHLYEGFDIETPVTVYCNKGKQSALTYFTLRHLGYNVSAYDGSWFEWGSMPNLPKWKP